MGYFTSYLARDSEWHIDQDLQRNYTKETYNEVDVQDVLGNTSKDQA